jgi:hypothetical protein
MNQTEEKFLISIASTPSSIASTPSNASSGDEYVEEGSCVPRRLAIKTEQYFIYKTASKPHLTMPTNNCFNYSFHPTMRIPVHNEYSCFCSFNPRGIVKQKGIKCNI